MQPVRSVGEEVTRRKRPHSEIGDENPEEPVEKLLPRRSTLEVRTCTTNSDNVAANVFWGQLTGRRGQALKQAEDILLGRYCSTLRPQLISTPQYDKIFACTWLDSERVMFGTKCNRMVVHNLRTLSQQEVQPPAVPPDEACPRPPTSPQINPYGACGIHSMRCNPSATLLATGGACVDDVAVLDAHDLTPRKLFVRHQDWVFQTAWASDHHLLSGGRDGKIVLWKVDLTEPGLMGGTSPLKIKEPHKGAKVRDLAHDLASGLTVSLEPAEAGPGALHVFKLAPTMRTMRKLPLHAYDTYSLAMSPGAGLVAVGSDTDVVLFDPRLPARSCEIGRHRHHDTEGVRSLSLNQHVVACGGSHGTLSFLDLRVGAWVEATSGCGPSVLRLHGGYCAVPEALAPLWEGFSPGPDQHALYSQAWSPSGLQLLAGGGPLQYGVRGCYAALFS